MRTYRPGSKEFYEGIFTKLSLGGLFGLHRKRNARSKYERAFLTLRQI